MKRSRLLFSYLKRYFDQSYAFLECFSGLTDVNLLNHARPRKESGLVRPKHFLLTEIHCEVQTSGSGVRVVGGSGWLYGVVV